MSKTIKQYCWCGMLCLLLIRCTANKPEQEKLAGYVGKAENGLTKKQMADSSEVTCQLVPQKKANEKDSNEVYKFMVYLRTKEKMTDSAMYFFNYRSAELFGLVAGADTIKPALSERVANGRRDDHEFTVVFDIGSKQLAGKSDLLFFMKDNGLFGKDLVFDYKYNDITKASKLLYGYDQVND